jgi:hypothetical protein
MWGLVICLLGSGVMLRADVEENPYQSIIDRNPFGLKPSHNSETNQAAAPVALNIKFTGISVVGEVKKAYFMDATKNPPTYYALGEGEQQESLKVTRIDDKVGAADIVNGGVATKVTFETHGNKNVVPGVAPPTPSAVPGAMPGGMPGAIPSPNFNPNAPKGAMPGMNLPNTMTGQPVQTGFNNPAVVPGAATATQDNLRMIPTRTVRTQPNPITTQVQPGLTPEASSTLLMINRELNREAVERKEMPPFPDPTVMQ